MVRKEATFLPEGFHETSPVMEYVAAISETIGTVVHPDQLDKKKELVEVKMDQLGQDLSKRNLDIKSVVEIAAELRNSPWHNLPFRYLFEGYSHQETVTALKNNKLSDKQYAAAYNEGFQERKASIIDSFLEEITQRRK